MSTQYKQDISNRIINLENTEDSAEAIFKLRSPAKGKLYRGPNWTAYNRENLGSIPGNIENILIKDSETKKLGFRSNSIRFDPKIDSLNSSSPGPATYYSHRDMNVSKPSFSSKGYGSGFCSTQNRFDDLKEFNERYKPGPGQYKVSDNSTISTEVSKSLCYRNIYHERNNRSLKVIKSNPGPGEYNPIDYMNKKINKNELNFFFRKELSRFEKNKAEIKPGPGKYYNSEASDFFIKDKESENYYFKNKTETMRDKEIELKYFKSDRIPEKINVPGVGTYNLRSKIGKSYENNMPYQIQKINEYEPPKIEGDFSNLKNDYYDIKSEIGKKPITSIFVSKSPKIKKIERISVPGPSYYKPQLLSKKLNFNFNIDGQWI